MSQDISIRSEYQRKIIHVGSSVFALLLRWLNFWQAALCALAALLFNWFILPRIGGRNIYRAQDHERGYPIGILLYPLSVLILIFLLPNHLYIVATAWGIMAWGDGFASIIGRKFGATKLPWNPNRSYAGTIAFLVVGGIAAIFFMHWTWKQPPEPVIWYLVGIPLLGTLLAAIIETIPAGIDDNLTVPIASGLFMFALLQIDPALIPQKKELLLNNLFWGAAVNLTLAGLSLALGMVSFSGFASGFLIGTTLYTFGGYELFLILFLFFMLGSISTKFGYAQKKSLGIAQEKGGARGWKNAVANCSLGVFLSILAMLSPAPLVPIFIAGVFGAFATAAADTVSSEIGQVLGKHPILITTLRPVAVGTEGAVSLEGTFAGIVASMLICAAGIMMNVLSIPAGLFCVLAAFIGTTVESYLGATLETMKIIDNEIINFMNTLVGAAAAMAFVALFL